MLEILAMITYRKCLQYFNIRNVHLTYDRIIGNGHLNIGSFNIYLNVVNIGNDHWNVGNTANVHNENW